MFAGYVKLSGTFVGTMLVRDSSDTPVLADALPTYRVYGPDGFVKAGVVSLRHTGNVTNATNATPIVITMTAHGFTTGSYVTVADVAGNTAANGTHVITKVDNNTFSLDSSVGNGSYTTGGTASSAGLYRYAILADVADGYEAGEAYQVHFEYVVSATNQSQTHVFQVN